MFNDPTAPFTLLFLLLTFGLVARITRLLVDDAITEPFRDKILIRSQPGGTFVIEQADPITGSPRVQKWNENPKNWKHKLAGFANKVLDCGWCCSVWVATEVVSVAAYVSSGHPHLLAAYWWVAAAGTASLVAGLIQTWTYSKDI